MYKRGLLAATAAISESHGEEAMVISFFFRKSLNVISTFFSYRHSYYPIIYVWLCIDVIPTLFPLHVFQHVLCFLTFQLYIRSFSFRLHICDPLVENVLFRAKCIVEKRVKIYDTRKNSLFALTEFVHGARETDTATRDRSGR